MDVPATANLIIHLDIDNLSIENSMDSEALSTEASPRDLSEAPLDNTATTSDTEQTAMEDSQSSPQIAVEPMLIETTETEDTIVVDTGESPQTIGPTSTTDTTEKTNATEEIIVEEAALASNTIPAAVAPQAIAEPTAEPAGETEEPAKPILSKKVCGICNEKQAKYKCSRCALPLWVHILLTSPHSDKLKLLGGMLCYPQIKSSCSRTCAITTTKVKIRGKSQRSKTRNCGSGRA